MIENLAIGAGIFDSASPKVEVVTSANEIHMGVSLS
jgi:hypothetical protein